MKELVYQTKDSKLEASTILGCAEHGYFLHNRIHKCLLMDVSPIYIPYNYLQIINYLLST